MQMTAMTVAYIQLGLVLPSAQGNPQVPMAQNAFSLKIKITRLSGDPMLS